MKRIKIVLLGSIPKGDKIRKDWTDWKQEYMNKISKAVPEASFLHGDLISDNKGAELVVGHDLWLIKHSDIVIVDARAKIGAGTAQEIVIAKKFKKPVISVIPKNTHHRRSNVVFHGIQMKDWVHPFLKLSSDVVVQNIEAAISWIKKNFKDKKKVKKINIYDKAVEKFEKNMEAVYQDYKKQGW